MAVYFFAGVTEKKMINSELWHACAGPLVDLPAAGTHVVYFPQGHSEQVAYCLSLHFFSEFIKSTSCGLDF